jgi:hypothetical protein
MRGIVLLIALALMGCTQGPMRRKPGSNMVLPAKPSLAADVISNLVCVATKAPAVAPPVGKTAVNCLPAAGRVADSSTMIRPPAR